MTQTLFYRVFPRLRALPLAALLAVMPLSVGGPARAQQPMSGGQPMPIMQAPNSQIPGRMGGPVDRVERQIERMHRALKITSAQEPQWQAFASIMRQNAADMKSLFKQRAQHLDQMTALEGLQSYERIAETHVANLRRLIPAFQAVYDALTPEQRRAADELFRYQRERRRARMIQQNGQMGQPPMGQPGQN